MTGLGKYGQDERMIETTVSQRREMASERFLKENEDQRAEREVLFEPYSPFGYSLRWGRTTSLAKRISNPRSRKLFDLSIAQYAISSSRTLHSTMNIVTRMPTTTRSDSRRCSQTSGQRPILRR
jgi:hypothetical protein